MKKQIKLQATELGNKYFKIYEVHASKYDGEIIIYRRFIDEKQAEESKKFAEEYLGELYEFAWIVEELVWC